VQTAKSLLYNRYIVRTGLVLVPFLALMAQHEFRDFGHLGQNWTPVPTGANEKTEWAFGRFRYPGGRRFGGHGGARAWGTDFPKADRQFVQGVRRLTRIHTRSAEQVIDAEDGDDLYYWPWLYAVEVGQLEWADAPWYPEKMTGQAYRLGINYIIYSMTH
jgi:Domain of unknown function (DUF4159)